VRGLTLLQVPPAVYFADGARAHMKAVLTRGA
jgi:hypothetical protein